MDSPLPHLRQHYLSIALLQPQIAPNTGNIGRLCVATGTPLHLVRPLGFVLSDQNLKRSAMDYWPRLKLTIHDDTDSFLRASESTRLWLFTSKASRSVWDVTFADGDRLVLGSETHGLPASVLNAYPTQTVRIPQAADERCLNLSTAAGIALYEALRQIRTAS
jgi:tRNA (cytidine/uridine-2'-O-)-methyltransferase